MFQLIEDFDKWQTTTSGGLLSQGIASDKARQVEKILAVLPPDIIWKDAGKHIEDCWLNVEQTKGILKGKTLQNYLYALNKLNTFVLCREGGVFPDLTALSLQIKNWIHALKTQVAREHVVLRQQQKGYLLSTILFAPFKTLLSEYMNMCYMY